VPTPLTQFIIFIASPERATQSIPPFRAFRDFPIKLLRVKAWPFSKLKFSSRSVEESEASNLPVKMGFSSLYRRLKFFSGLIG
jgi:hypothetical protein